MLTKLKNIFHYNFKNMLKFEFIFKLLTIIIFSPLFLKLFNLIMNITGFPYLTKENFFSFLSNPLTIIMLILLFILMTFYSLFDIGVIIVLIDGSYQKKTIALKEAIKYSFKRALKVFQLKNILMIFLVIFLIPFLNIGIGANLISSIKIPEFIMEYIHANQTLFFFFIILIIFLIGLLLRWIYSLHYYFLEDCSFRKATIKSKNLSKHHHLKDLLKIGLTQFLIIIIYLLFIAIEILIIILINKVFNHFDILNSFLITITWLIILLSLIIYSILSTAVSYTILSVLFYQHKTESKEDIHYVSLAEEKVEKKKKNLVVTIITFIILIILTCLTYLIINGKLNLNIEYVRTMEVTAHRGASVLYPENTMQAFIGAKDLGADWVELDVQQTKDNYIIVIHDSNFKRTAGVNLNTWEATLSDIQKLDVGSFKDKKFKGEPVPLLEDVIKWAKENNMKLNIELKPTGYEDNFEQNVADIIEKYHFEKDCVITSQVYEVLENFKKVNKDITTAYVTALAYGDVTKLEAADYFSVEASSVTKSMVSRVHNEGKQIYAWTVNTKENMNKMIELNVDNIITDDPTLAKNLIYSSKSSNLITELIKGIDKIFN